MKDILNRYQNIKPEKRKIILLISLLIITISVTYAFFAPLIGEGVTTNINTQTGLTDDLYFESGNTLSITADQYNFAEGKGNLSDTTTASAYLRANTGNETATQYYEVYLNIKKNEFKTVDYYPELILNVYGPDGTEITNIGALEYNIWETIRGYNITESIGKIPIKEINEIISNSSSKYTVQDWKFMITFVNWDYDQSVNAGKTFEAEIIMEHTEKLDPVMAIYSEDDYSLRFYQYDGTVAVGDQYNSLTVSEIYTGLEYTDFYWYYSDIEEESINNIHWFDIRFYLENVVVEDDIKVKNTRRWFEQIPALTFDLEKLDTSEVVDMSWMFNCIGGYSNAWSLDKLELKGLEYWDVGKVSNMSLMFNNAGSYVNDNMFSIGDLSNWDTSNVVDMSSMFYSAFYNYDGEVSLGDIGKWKVSNVKNMSDMFSSAGSDIWDIGDIGKWDVSNVTNMSGMFSEAWIDEENWNIADLSNWNVANVTDMSYMFGNTGDNATTWSIGDLSDWDVSNVIDMSSMFSGAGYNATTWSVGDLSDWDVSNVIDMSDMFYSAGQNFNWSVGDLSNWNVANVTDMSGMFGGTGDNATTWSIGDLSDWDVSNVIDMSSMFSGAGYNATTWSVGDLSDWDVSNVIDMSYMFSSAGQNSTTWSIGDLSNWNTSKVTNMKSMFKNAGINAQYTLDLRAWESSEVTNHTDFNTGVESKIIPPVWVN